MLVLLLKHTYRQLQVRIHVILHLIHGTHKINKKINKTSSLNPIFRCEILLHCLVKFLETTG